MTDKPQDTVGHGTSGSSHRLAEMGRQLQILADSLADARLEHLVEKAEDLAQRNPALLLVGSLALGLDLCRSGGAQGRASRYLNERPHDWGHSPAMHGEASGAGDDDEKAIPGNEPDEAQGRVGDLRHRGESLHDKAGDLGRGSPAQGPDLPGNAERHGASALSRLHTAQPLVIGALGIAAGALLASLWPEDAEPSPEEGYPDERGAGGRPESGLEPMPRRSRPGPC